MTNHITPDYVRISRERIRFLNPQRPERFFRIDGCNYTVNDDGFFAQRVHNIRICRSDCSCKNVHH
jgi:hypothetical protein